MVQVRKSLLRGWNIYHTTIESDGGGSSSMVHISRCDRSSVLKELFESTNVKRNLEGTDCRKLDIFSFLATSFIN